MLRGRLVVFVSVVACAPREAEVPAPTATSVNAVVVAGSGRGVVAAGLVHSCVVVRGAVHCWGYNGHGELGDGTREDRRRPAAVVGIEDAVMVVAGAGHACALRRGGTVVCWGDGGEGQVGDGTRETRLVPVAVDGLTGVSQLAAGSMHTCAIGQAGAVWCWGMNVFGEVDAQGPAEQLRPVRVAGVTGSAIAAGGNYSCAVDEGRVRCWGQMPLPDGAETEMAQKTGGVVTVPGVVDAVEVAAGDRHVCVRTNGGGVLCWGEGRDGQRGDGVRDVSPSRWNGPHPPPHRKEPRGVATVDVRDAAQVVAGGDSTCVRTGGGAVLCWGANRDGQLGDGGSEVQARPVAARVDGAVDLSFGAAHACAVRVDRSVWCWGYNEFGQADARGIAEEGSAAVAVGRRATAVAVGGGHVCALGEGRVWCVGENAYGQLGDGTRTARTEPVVVPGIRDAVQVIAGARHACVVLRDGGVRCWGDDTFGQMGQRGAPGGEPFDEHSGPLPLADIAARSSVVPVTPVGLGAVRSLAVHEHWTCALQVDGAVACWHAAGEVPVTVVQRLPATTQSLAVGAVHSCVVLADGAVNCWGLNFYGRIGDGTRVDRPTPTPVVGLRGPAVMVTAGRLHTCALLRDGGVACWGTGFAGRLGDGAEQERDRPVMVKGLTDATWVTAGHEYTCALRRGGAAVCWGDNADGVLGDGTRGSRSLPVDVKGVTATALAAGEHHACAVRGDGEVVCWGEALTQVAGPRGETPGWSVVRVPVSIGVTAGS